MEKKVKKNINIDSILLSFTPENFLNWIIYSMVIVMPFIISFSGDRRYVDGKARFLYLGTVIALLVVILTTKVKLRREHIIGLIFLSSIGLATIFSTSSNVYWGNVERREGFLMYIVYILLFIFSTNFMKINTKIIDIFLVSASVMSFYSVMQMFGVDPIQVHFFGSVVTTSSSIGTIGNYNFLSTYMILFLMLSVGLYIYKDDYKYLSFSTLIFFGLLASRTRGGWLTVGFVTIVLLVYFLVKKKKEYAKRLGYIFLGFFVALVVLNTTSGNQILERASISIFSFGASSNQTETSNVKLEGSFASRANIARIAFKAFVAKPLIGEGPDTLADRINSDFNSDLQDHIKRFNESIDKAHNEFLEYAACDGIFTIGSYILLLVLIFRGLIKGKKDDESKVLMIVVASYLIQSVFNISVIMVAPIFWILLGYCVQKIYKDIEEKRLSSEDTTIEA